MSWYVKLSTALARQATRLRTTTVIASTTPLKISVGQRKNKIMLTGIATALGHEAKRMDRAK
jgi:hypothetical protein